MLKILAVDDENLVRVALRSMIDWEEQGFEFVGTAGDGVEALAMVEKYEPDIVITDLKMPNLDGIGLIQALKERGFGGKIVALSNYGEFELVRQALMLGAADYVLKVTMVAENFAGLLKNLEGALCSERAMKQKLQDEQIQLKQSKTILKNNFFQELFREETGFDYQRITVEAQNAGLKPTLPKSVMFYISIDNFEKTLGDLKIADRKQLLFSIRQVIMESFHQVADLEVIEVDHRSLVAVIPAGEFQGPENARQRLPEQAAEKIAGLLKLYLNISVTIVVSHEFEGFYGAKISFSDCVKALRSKFYGLASPVIRIDGEIQGKIPAPGSFIGELAQILPTFTAGDIQGALEQIREMGNQAQQARVDPVYLKKQMVRLLEGLEMEAGQSGPEPELERMKERIFNAQTLGDLLERASELLRRLCELWKESGGSLTSGGSLISSLSAVTGDGPGAGAGGKDTAEYRKEVRDVIQFIRQNYRKKITIEMMARQVNLNPSYICRVFKSETGESIFTYINRVRMEKAAELLRVGDLSIKEVADQVGLDDPFYFNRLFKKYFGVSPTNFKKDKR